MRTLIEDFWREEHFRAGYDIVYSPHIGKSTLWETSGHLNFYNENMYSPMDIDGQDYYVKPMNCPFHIQMYKSSLRSYRELPIRMAELGTVYRYERSGVLHGLLRVRGFTQDDAHIFCRPDQVQAEIERCVEFTRFFLGAFGFEQFHVYLSTRDAAGKYAGSLEDWDMATNVLRDVIDEHGLPYDVDEGGAVFYGPKIDVKMLDALGREWQCTTIQFDFNLPERFDVSYIGEDGREHRPYMVHRALLGSMERFFGVLIEHYGGAFPLWLAPVQAVVIPIADRHLDYAQQGGRSSFAPQACGSRSTTAASECRRRSATRSSRRCRTCSSSATARQRRTRRPCACAAARTSRPDRWRRLCSVCLRRSASGSKDQGAAGSVWQLYAFTRGGKCARQPLLPLSSVRDRPPIPQIPAAAHRSLRRLQTGQRKGCATPGRQLASVH